MNRFLASQLPGYAVSTRFPTHLEDLDPEERLKGLKAEEIEAYLKNLKKDSEN